MMNSKLLFAFALVSGATCPRGVKTLIDTETLKGDRGAQGSQGPQGDPGESGSSEVLCYATFTTNSPPLLRNSGGELTFSA